MSLTDAFSALLIIAVLILLAKWLRRLFLPRFSQRLGMAVFGRR